MKRVVIWLALLTLAACGGDDNAGAPPPPSQPAPAGRSTQAEPQVSLAPGCQTPIRNCMQQRKTPPPTVIDPSKSYSATIRTAKGDFVVKLDPKAAPVTVNNFVYLAQNHFYDGLTFHRVEPGFVVQGGDPNGDGRGGPGYKLPNETNPAPWVKGSLGMASSPDGVNGSQFFVLLGDAPHLANSGAYNHFGSVVSGAEVVAALRPGDRINSIVVSQ